jgi:hypothetical protein
MSKIKSLQYLLLDSLSKRDRGLSKKLSKTLSVSENNSYYIINWQDDRNLKKLEIEKFKFKFYQRNDLENNKKDLKNILKTNNENAEYIVDQILKSKKKINNSLNFIAKYISHIFIIIIFLSIAINFTNISNKFVPILLIFFFVFELLDKRKITFYLSLLMLSFFSPNEFIFFFSLFLVIFNLLEPIFFLKKTKIIMLLIIISINFNFLSFSSINFDINFILINILILLNLLFNFIRYNSNYNWIYCIPAFSYGFFYNEEIILSYFWIFICFFIHYLFNYLDKIFFLKIKTSPILE